MKEYKINKDVRKEDFIRNGFSYCDYNVLQMKKYLYKHEILLTIIVDFTEPEIGLYTNITYSNGNTYPTYNPYGKDEVRKSVTQNYNKEMNKLQKIDLIKEK